MGRILPLGPTAIKGLPIVGSLALAHAFPVTRPLLEVPPGYRALALRTPTLPPAAHTNCYVVGHRGALIVDPGSPYRGEQQLLEALLYRLRGGGGELAAVVLTHHHRDHVGAALAIARRFELPLWAHEATFARLPAAFASLAQRPLVEGDVLLIDGERELEVLHTPGHAPGHLCLLERTPGIASGSLLAGDMIPGLGTTLIDPSEGSMVEYLHELRRLAARGPRRVLPAHGPMLAPAVPAIEGLLAHREAREQRVLGALATTPRPLDAVAAEAYAELPVVATLLAQRSTLAHLVKLGQEGLAQAHDGQRWSR